MKLNKFDACDILAEEIDSFQKIKVTDMDVDGATITIKINGQSFLVLIKEI